MEDFSAGIILHARTPFDVGVAYGTDLDRAIAALKESVDAVRTVLTDPPPQVVVSSYDDSAIRTQVLYLHAPGANDDSVARDDTIRTIDRALKAWGIVIGIPQQDVWLRMDDH